MTSTTTTTVSAALARTRASYDATPYESAPLVRQQPARMAAAALWFGLTAPGAATARVLEIGCASGGHIIPLAAVWPGARFLGVDLSPAQIKAGEARIARLGLENIALRAVPFSDICAKDGDFDFIVCHGVLSWIDGRLRRDLLRVISERLAENGVAAVSFNVLPGWRLFQIARDSLLLHASLQNDPAARAIQARELLDALAEESNDKFSYGRFWRDEARRLAAGGDAYIAHEIFEDDNAPMTFLDFCALLDSYGLAYLGECNLAGNFEGSIAPAGAGRIRALSRGDERAREQYIDIFTGRAFREALIVHSPRAGAIRRGIPPPDQLGLFHFVAPLTLAVKAPPVPGGPWRAGEGDGEGVVIEDEATAQAILRLIARLPGSSRLEDIAPEASTAPALRERVAGALARLVAFGHLAVSSEPVACASRLAERPVAWPLAASDALAGERTASLRHAPVRLEPLQRLFLPLLDGTRTRDDLLAQALALAVEGALTISGPDGPVEGRDSLAGRLGPAVDRTLEGLLRLGLLAR
jgi:SAM-dependent methyltransferase